ncbi:cysteine-rich venom protein TEL1-like [Mixophyes fleayi]|uniref:cysteine-rich venom protein TEL1-like n=1 Tax=Mixophyes fleayi TaxID=3061075 RepID=UPI003F4D9AF3
MATPYAKGKPCSECKGKCEDKLCDLASHCDHVKEVLSRLRTNKLYCKLEKCVFEKPQIPFLGYIVSGAEAIDAFEALKKAFSSASVLVQPDQDKSFLVEVDASADDPIAKLSCDNDDIKKLIVDRHNELRSQVVPPPSNMLLMEWCDEAAENAAKWAKNCVNGHSKVQNRTIPGFTCGENLYMANRPHSWIKAMQGWWDENQDFEHGKGAKEEGKVIGHYTQFVWYKSWKVGCAVNYCPQNDLCYIFVCHYCPAGNVKKIINAPYVTGDKCSNCSHACKDGLCTNPCPYNDDVDGCSDYKDMCDSEEESMEEEYKIKNMCKETCSCDTEI